MTSPYWPATREVKVCIRTEAEELADAVVLAVHEPMTFRRAEAREGNSEMVGETELLEHVVKNSRPTPVIGESGFGKSHVIRWLHLQLMRRKRKDWHIVRIGKNASLRQALTTLLADLKGPLFDDARRKIDVVGTGLKARDVAEHLVVFVGARLSQLFEETQQQVGQLSKSGQVSTGLDAAQETRIKAVRRHAKPGGMASLLGDPNFKIQFLAEGRCFFQIAKRLTEGSSDEEIESRPSEVRPEDLVIEGNLDDLSLEARRYVRNAQLNTSEDMRVEAAALLNECLNDASRAAFQQLFQFHGGSFQDLFVAIRETLKLENKTLFVLVEDMATISAIEDVLIDSLMQEEIREGKQLLCPLHSAIAVTTGYQGYKRRQASLSTRARYEWYIERTGATESETLARIEDFCGRYLNAARHGEKHLVDTFRDGQVDAVWPGIWQSPDAHYKHTAEIFGESPKQYPLFPYSRLALAAMAKRYCRRGDVLEFNPRKILAHVLHEPLTTFRDQFARGEFPPEGFANIECPGSLQIDLGRGLREDIARAETLAAIWGYGAETMSELAHEMPAEIAREFNIADLATILDASERRKPKSQTGPNSGVRTKYSGATGGSTKPLKVEDARVDDALAASREVDEYFTKGSIPQGVANEVRKALADAFENRRANLSDWYGIETWPVLKQRALTLIRIPFNNNNPPATKLEFGTEKDFKDSRRSLRFKQFMVAVLRQNRAAEGDQKSWAYLGGEQDYYNYSNFLDEWLPNAASALCVEGRAAADSVISAQIAATTVFDPQIANRALAERLDQLVMTPEAIKRKIRCQTGLQEWDQFLDMHITEWTGNQKSWLEAYSTNRHGLEGDLVIKVIRRSSEIVIPAKAQRVAQKVALDFATRAPAFALLDGCATQEEFQELLVNLHGMVGKLSSASQFQGMDGKVQARTYKDRLARLIDGVAWEPTKTALALRQPFEAGAVIKALHGFDIGAIEPLKSVLETWSEFYAVNKPRMRNENEEQGAGQRQSAERMLAELIDRLGRVVAQLGEQQK